MNWQNASLAMAGLIGGGTAVIHGVLTQRLMVRPIEALMASDRRISAPVRRLVPLLLHFSTIAWLLGGLALIAAACWFGPQARLATGLCVGGLYLLRRARQSVGHARPPSRLDADGGGARADRRSASA